MRRKQKLEKRPVCNWDWRLVAQGKSQKSKVTHALILGFLAVLNSYQLT
ncbi:hypothetical protein GXM_02528 [Nostoc sphaeroides CCNUC1]|uniref:Uncharacterized protein n=1 Tax=Nostoc sphaeroides CCNUC1 TaxID=2653204 RepID=A0A5P8VX92_9NOSO|nr:hypothetical protein GXM_02528 [Nostoc sphaeroides CCNUC1]